MSPDLRSSDAVRRRTRRYLEARDGRTCVRCGDPIPLDETASIGHVVARARGGTDAPDNLRLEHLVCNLRAGADRTRARIVEVADLAAVFHRSEIRPTEPPSAWNGARNGPAGRTSVRFRPSPRRW